MINNVVLVGRLVKDPELKYSVSGVAVTNFRIAVDRRVSGEGEEKADFFSVVCFKKTAEVAAEFLDKGALVGVEGRLQSRSWEGDDGRRQYMVEVVADGVRFLESKAEADRRRGVDENRNN